MAARQRVQIFLASSEELVGDRREFEIHLSRRNQLLWEEDIFYDLIIWEDFVDAMSRTRLQDEYNRAIQECDIFFMLFFTKVGKYTREEFEVAFGSFVEAQKPLVYVYFKDSPGPGESHSEQDRDSVLRFHGHLRELGHFCPSYSSTEDLLLQVHRQLDLLRPKRSSRRSDGELALDVSVLSRPSWPAEETSPPTLAYRHENTADALVVQPDMSYLDRLRSGDRVAGIRYWECPFRWSFPALDVQVINNSDSTVAISRLEIEVSESTLDDEPLLVVRDGTFNGLEISNEGWGRIFDAHLEVQSPDAASEPREVRVGTIEHRKWVEWPWELPRAPAGDETDEPIRVQVRGVLRYHAEAVEDGAPARVFPFSTRIFLGAEPDAAAAEPSAVYQAWISAGAAPQHVSVPCSHTLEAGAHDRFVVSVASERSHRFVFRLRICFVHGERLESRLVSCHMLVPRSGGDQIDEARGNASALAPLSSLEGLTVDEDKRTRWCQADGATIAGSSYLQLSALRDLDDDSAEVRRAALRVIGRATGPNDVNRAAVLRLVAEEDDHGVLMDALHLLVSGGFTVNQVLSALLGRAGSEPFPPPLLAVYCLCYLWLYVGSQTVDEAAVKNALSRRHASEFEGVFLCESFAREIGWLGDETAARARERLKSLESA